MPVDKVLVVEDNDAQRENLLTYLRGQHYEVHAAACLDAARQVLDKDVFDLVFLDLRLPDGEGIQLLREMPGRDQAPLVVVLTGNASVKSAVDCLHAGAFDYLPKPFGFEEIDLVLEKAGRYSRLVRVNQCLSHDDLGTDGGEMLGQSASMLELRQLIRRVARTEATVLIQGESGTGKEVVARELYRQSSRAHAPFIKVNCAAIPENLIESEFFGHEKGAFTGALSKREGRFELAHGGTILLDEISEISPALQAKLLRVLQERELERVGGTRTIKVDVRVIATTNRRLEECVARKEFRQDLYFRLNVVPIHVPPLRQRAGDIGHLAEEFRRRFARRHGIRVEGFCPECQTLLLNHPWPGNVRELQNVIERAVILCGESGLLAAEHLGLDQTGLMSRRLAGLCPIREAADLPPTCPLREGLEQAAPPPSPARTESFGTPQPAAARLGAPLPTLADMERQHIFAALSQCQNNRTHAARLLDISVRTLRNKLKEYGAGPADPDDEPVAEDAATSSVPPS